MGWVESENHLFHFGCLIMLRGCNSPAPRRLVFQNTGVEWGLTGFPFSDTKDHFALQSTQISPGIRPRVTRLGFRAETTYPARTINMGTLIRCLRGCSIVILQLDLGLRQVGLEDVSVFAGQFISNCGQIHMM